MKEWFCTRCIRELIGNTSLRKFETFDNNVCGHCGMLHCRGKWMDRETLMHAAKDPTMFVEKDGK